MNWARELEMSPLDVRVLRATDPSYDRTVPSVARIASCSEEVTGSCLRRLRGHGLVEVDGCRPPGWRRTRNGDLVLEHQP